MRDLLIYRCIIHDKGFIPIEAILYIVHLDPAGKPIMEHSENVVPFKPRGPAA